MLAMRQEQVSSRGGCFARVCDTSETALSAPPSLRHPSYDGVMKDSTAASSPLRLLLVLLATVVLLAANAMAQTENPQAANEPSSSIAAARCQYTFSDTNCARARGNDSAQAPRGAIDDATLAQLPRRGPGPGFGPRGPMGRAGYPGMWQSEPNGRHALIGAVIGGLLGWAVAAKGSSGARATLGIATVGAGLGAAVGLSVPSFPSRGPYWHRWPRDDDDEDAAARKSAKPSRAPDPPQQTASVEAAPSILGPNAEAAPTPKTAAQP